VVKRLLEIGVDPWRKDRQGRTPVDDAAANEEVKTAFAEYCDEENITDKNRESILFLCVHLGLVTRLTAVLRSGANLECTDKEGNSCLHIAAAHGSNEILHMLLNAGAKVSAKNEAGNTAVELAQNAQTIDLLKGAGATMPEFPEEKKNDLLLEYAKKGATGGALMALQAGADVNCKDTSFFGIGMTPLHFTAFYNKPEVAKVLLANGAQVNVGDNGRRTALRVAREYDSFGRWSPLVGNPEMEALLRQHGAEIEVMPPTIRRENTSARRAMHGGGGVLYIYTHIYTHIHTKIPTHKKKNTSPIKKGGEAKKNGCLNKNDKYIHIYIHTYI
jgi:ankyrin repeat protein